MAKVFVVSLAEGPLREGEIAGRVRSVDTDTEIVVHDSHELLAAMLDPGSRLEPVPMRPAK